MFLVDNLLLAPGKALLFVFQEMARKAQEEWLDDDSIKKELQELYALLDSGRMDEKEFEAKEYRLLERLEQIAKVKFQEKWGGEEAVSSTSVAALAAGPVIDAELPSPQNGGDTDPAQISPEPTSSPESSEVSGSSVGTGILQALRPLLDLGHFHSEADGREAPPYQVEAEASVRPLFEFEVADVPPPAPAPQRTFPATPVPAIDARVDAQPVYQPMRPVADSVTRVTASAAPGTVMGTQAPVYDTSPKPHEAVGPADASPMAASPGGRTIAMAEVVDNAIRCLSLTKLKLSSVTSVAKAEDGWRVGIELVERASVPDTSDLLGVYEVRLDGAGTVTRYERTRVRRRNDLSR